MEGETTSFFELESWSREDPPTSVPPTTLHSKSRTTSSRPGWIQHRRHAAVSARGSFRDAELRAQRNGGYSEYNSWPVVDGDLIRNWGSVQLDKDEFVKVSIIASANVTRARLLARRGSTRQSSGMST